VVEAERVVDQVEGGSRQKFKKSLKDIGASSGS